MILGGDILNSKKRTIIISLCFVFVISGIFVSLKSKKTENIKLPKVAESNEKADQTDLTKVSFTIDQLSNAVFENDTDMVNKIVKNSTIDINGKDSNGKYPLEMVMDFENCEMAEELLKAGANPDVIASDGSSIYDTVMKGSNKYMKGIFKKYKSKWL